MPKSTGQSSLNFAGALKAHATDVTMQPQDFSRPPAGISNGVAELTAMSIGTYKNGPNKGQKFWRAVGTIISPDTCLEVVKEFKGGKVVTVGSYERHPKGLQTSIMIPLCDTGVGDRAMTGEENIADMLNMIRLIAGDESTADVTDEASLDAVMEAIVAAAPHVRFSTNAPDPTAAYPNHRAFERWYGTTTASANGQPPAAPSPAAGVTEEVQPEPEPEVAATDDEVAVDLEALVEAAGKKDGAAQKQLRDLALKYGVDEEFVDADDTTWQMVADAIEATAPSEPVEAEGEAPAEPEPIIPAPKDACTYQPLDAKGNKLVGKDKKPIKPQQCVVVTVSKAKETVTLKNLTDGKTLYKDIPWDQLKEPK